MLIHLKTLGCRLNEAELESFAQGFQKYGHSIIKQAEKADLIVLNSCAVTQDAARKSRSLIRRLHRENPTAKLVVSGCYASLNTDETAALLGVDLVVRNQDKKNLVEKTLQALNLDSMPIMSTEPGETSLFTRGRQRAFIKVQDGCRYRCAFCIVTVARGEEVSRPVSEIIDEINVLYEQGIQEVILTGVHLGGYGSDVGLDLTHLCKAVLEQTQIPRLRLGSLEPWELSESFYQLFTDPRVMPHLHLPLQSGCDSVLRRMARRCKTAEYTEIVKRLRGQTANFNITTDIIVGFPGETDENWQNSFDFIKQLGFGHVHIFSFSPRAGTKAATLPDQVAAEVKKQRSQALHALVTDMQQQFYQENIGQHYPVLWEAYSESLANHKQRVFGYTPNYLRVACVIDDNRSLENQILPVKLTTVEKDFIHAEH